MAIVPVSARRIFRGDGDDNGSASKKLSFQKNPDVYARWGSHLAGLN
ncbi:hypothetical protein C5167_016620 [Papaver somniferum]|nr:hypothetical protein C5167_016620 [Papaver somniferum]